MGILLFTRLRLSEVSLQDLGRSGFEDDMFTIKETKNNCSIPCPCRIFSRNF